MAEKLVHLYKIKYEITFFNKVFGNSASKLIFWPFVTLNVKFDQYPDTASNRPHFLK